MFYAFVKTAPKPPNTKKPEGVTFGFDLRYYLNDYAFLKREIKEAPKAATAT